MVGADGRDDHPDGWSATLAFARLMRLGVEVGEPAVGAQPGLDALAPVDSRRR
jgi:hypothetical protein